MGGTQILPEEEPEKEKSAQKIGDNYWGRKILVLKEILRQLPLFKNTKDEDFYFPTRDMGYSAKVGDFCKIKGADNQTYYVKHNKLESEIYNYIFPRIFEHLNEPTVKNDLKSVQYQGQKHYLYISRDIGLAQKNGKDIKIPIDISENNLERDPLFLIQRHLLYTALLVDDAHLGNIVEFVEGQSKRFIEFDVMLLQNVYLKQEGDYYQPTIIDLLKNDDLMDLFYPQYLSGENLDRLNKHEISNNAVRDFLYEKLWEKTEEDQDLLREDFIDQMREKFGLKNDLDDLECLEYTVLYAAQSVLSRLQNPVFLEKFNDFYEKDPVLEQIRKDNFDFSKTTEKDPSLDNPLAGDAAGFLKLLQDLQKETIQEVSGAIRRCTEKFNQAYPQYQIPDFQTQKEIERKQREKVLSDLQKNSASKHDLEQKEETANKKLKP